MNHLLVLRFSALGDVSMTATVVRAALEQNPDLRITWVTRPLLAEKIPAHPRLVFWTTDFRGVQQTPWGVLSWIRQQMRTAAAEGHPVEAVADLHRNLRTRVVCAGLGWRGLPVERLVKDRIERRQLRLKGALHAEAITPVTTRMAEVFQRLGLALEWTEKTAQSVLPTRVAPAASSAPKLYFAPTARHKTKQWPLNYAQELLVAWMERGGEAVLAGSAAEREELDRWIKPEWSQRCTVTAGMNNEEEAAVRRTCHVAVTLDSANLHLAVQSGLPVVSIWGGTHPKAGFVGLGHPNVHVLQAPDPAFPCRPCSIFGKSTCALGDVPCLHAVEVKSVLERAWEVATSA
jgi:ADP-heptose:LPS heptosyltransferase